MLTLSGVPTPGHLLQKFHKNKDDSRNSSDMRAVSANVWKTS